MLMGDTEAKEVGNTVSEMFEHFFFNQNLTHLLEFSFCGLWLGEGLV